MRFAVILGFWEFSREEMSFISSGDVKSAVRVIQIFRLFAELKRPLALSSISSKLAFPKSSCLALLNRTLRKDLPQKFPRPTLRQAVALLYANTYLSPDDDK